ncbi:hypothetical protein CPB86DRAFT_795427 [Serendipita vermifera]|nr:hypothetical protein CPB86DRAFT_795427 [Serendipita vermifera]
MSSQTAMASNTQTSQTDPSGPAGPGLIQEQVQNATPSQTVCRHTAPGSLANFDLWFEGEDPTWRAAERTILVMRDAVNREAGENDTAEIEQTAEDSEMDVDDLEASQAALEAHVALPNCLEIVYLVSLKCLIALLMRIGSKLHANKVVKVVKVVLSEAGHVGRWGTRLQEPPFESKGK